MRTIDVTAGEDGSFSVPAKLEKSGSYAITASYAGSELYEPSTACAVEENNVVIVDFTTTSDPQVPDDIEVKLQVATFIANSTWEEATRRKDFGCVIVSDEAHRIAPERAYGGVYAEKMSPVWIRLATEGGRNGCPLWFVARRLSLVSKAVTTELQQNFICFNVEDVDRERVRQDLGRPSQASSALSRRARR